MSLKDLIKHLNNEQKIYNEKRYGPVTNDTIIITIQVHNRVTYLSHLIDSLRTAQDIDKTLLIFSHDLYNSSINQLVRGIDFCMVMQIFYPYSIQLYSDEFPGTDRRDCSRDIERSEAIKSGCLNAFNDDTYGHYREAKFTQMKHHWWWKLNRIFDELHVTRNYKGMLLLLEEDYYVASDFFHVYRLMQQFISIKCPQCNILSLGTHSQYYDEHESYNNIIEISPWHTSKHNMGMAFNKTTWLEVRKCATHFCNYDEYNYDFSFQNVNQKCLSNHLFVALIKSPPRVFHVGECGVHHVKENCDNVEMKINEINEKLDEMAKEGHLYPKDLGLGDVDLFHTNIFLTKNGGWSDKRDQCLCYSMINSQHEVDLQKCRNLYEKRVKYRKQHT